jgi:metal-responsive CopG/Arc/MetJ family transcriptional regulator
MISVTGRSGRGTARQTIRVDEKLWEEFGEACNETDSDRSSYLRDVIRWALGKPKSPAPRRLPKVEGSG